MFAAPARRTLTLAGAAALPVLLHGRPTAARAALALADALENLDEAEIDLPQLHVDADDLNLHLVSEPVHLLRVLAPQHMRAVDEPVIIVRHRRNVNQPLDEMLDELHEQTEGGDPCHVA